MSKPAAAIFLVFVFTFAISAQSGTPFAPDTIIEQVVTAGNASQSYALYLPAGYDPKRSYPAIYVFDPGGRGVNAVTTYRKAAAKFGYIVIGSNNSQNGLDAAKLNTILNGLWLDTHQRFAIDDKRVVAAGFSGGARVASSFANACKCVFAVVGSGAGFSQGSVVPSKSLPFIFVGTAGVDDMNYPELRDLQKRLTAAGVANRLLTFDGGHQWPPADVIDRALEWIELRAMLSGLRAKDDSFITASQRARESDGDARLAANDYLAAHEYYASAANDLSGQAEVAGVAKKLADLEASPGYKRALKADADAADRQNNLLSEVMGLEQGLDATPETRADAMASLRDKIQSVRSHFDDAQDSPERRLARRVITSIIIGAMEAATLRFEPAKNYEMALTEMDVAAVASPKSPEIPYQQARIYALKGDRKKSLQFLKKAIGNGFKDAGRIDTEAAFATLRGEAEFKALLLSPATNPNE